MRTAVASSAVLAAALLVSACGPGARAPGIATSPDGVVQSPAPQTPFVATVPSGAATTATVAQPSDVVLRMKWCVDTCIPEEATVVMRDGRVTWNEPGVGLRQGQLAPEGVAWVEAQLAGTGLLDAAGRYEAELRPGAQPEGGGASSFEFITSSPSGPVRVTAGIPGNADDRYWIVPAALRTLADLAGRVLVADTWIPADLWLEAATPYVPRQYLLLVTLNPQRTSDAIDPRAVVDVDRVLWPMPGSLDTVTPVARGVNDMRARCAVLDAGMAQLVDTAQRAQGLPGEPRPPFADRAYLWARGGGFLTVEFQPLMPDEHDCGPAQFALD